MLKRIPKSDISVRPFKAYKEWNFNSGSAQNALSSSFEFNERVLIYNANDNFAIDEYLEIPYTSSKYPDGNIHKYYPKSIYGQLRTQFYNENDDNPFVRFGEKTNVYNTDSNSKERFLSGSAKIISIPQIYVGEGIKKGSVRFLDNEEPYIDDGYGNLVSEAGLSEMDFNQLDLTETSPTVTKFNFTAAGQSFTASIDFYDEPWFVDIQSASIEMKLNGNSYTSSADIISIDIEAGAMYVKNSTFLPSLMVGNVFYNQGLMVLTRNLNTILNSDWGVSYKSTKTIYEHEYLLVAEQDEFNVSTNPSAIINLGKTTEKFVDTSGKIIDVTTNPGVSYIRKKTILENGNILDYRYTGSVPDKNGIWHYAGFEHYFESSSADSTGSFLTPFITTIGLYDDNCDLVAVAKLPQPIKSEHDIPVNFIVRFDT